MIISNRKTHIEKIQAIKDDAIQINCILTERITIRLGKFITFC